MKTYVQFIRSKIAEDLIDRDPYAFAILSKIAQRARRTNDPVSGLKVGEAMIGRKEFTLFRHSMSEKNYRNALVRLQKYGFVAYNGTKKGTIVRLINSDIYDINGPTEGPWLGPTGGQQGANRGPTGGQQGATNNNDKNVNNGKNGNYDPDLRLTVLNVRGEKVEGTLGEILNGIFSRYPGNANFHDRPAVAHFIMANPDYPLSMAVSREISQDERGIPSRNIQNFINNPPDELQVRSWFKRNNNE